MFKASTTDRKIPLVYKKFPNEFLLILATRQQADEPAAINIEEKRAFALQELRRRNINLPDVSTSPMSVVFFDPSKKSEAFEGVTATAGTLTKA